MTVRPTARGFSDAGRKNRARGSSTRKATAQASDIRATAASPARQPHS